jgi:hypothetical protein
VADRQNPTGNERLTATVGALFLVPIVVELATIVLGVTRSCPCTSSSASS